MEETLNNAELIWKLVNDINILAHWSTPFLPLIISIVWAGKEKSTMSFIALFGGFLIAAARYTHMNMAGVESMHAGHLVPDHDQNPLIWFFYIHAYSLGNFIFIACVGFYFLFQHSAKNKEEDNTPHHFHD